MERTRTKWRMLALLAPLVGVAAVLAFFAGSGSSGPGSAQAGTTPNLTGVSCADIYLDLNNDGIPDDNDADGNGKFGDPGDIISKSISRTEPSQSLLGEWDITVVSYLGPDTDNNLIPNRPPTVGTCQGKSTAAATGAEAGQMDPRVFFASQFGNRPTATATLTLNTAPTPDELTFSTCGFSESVSAWVRVDTKVFVASTGPGAKNLGDGVLYLATSSPAGTVPGKPNEALNPSTCDPAGALAFNFVFETHGRDARTDHTSLSKNAPLITAGKLAQDLDGPHPKVKGVDQVNDTADGVADDWDGDGCPDWDELDKNFTHAFPPTLTGPVNGLDPFNPNDCDSNFDSMLRMNLTITRFAGLPFPGHNTNKCTLAQILAGTCRGNGFYVHCRADMQHDKTNNNIVLRTMCYSDNTISTVNETAAGAPTCGGGTEAHCGDGKSGPPPPKRWPLANGAAETGANCANLTDDDSDNAVNDGCASTTFGGISPISGHIQALGVFDKVDNRLEFAACFKGFGGSTFGPNVYARGAIDGHTGAGTLELWGFTDAELADCQAGNVPAQPEVEAEVLMVEVAAKPAGDTIDSDLDRCPDKTELSAIQGDGGLRDPFNEWDYFNPTKDGLNRVDDILFVVNQYFDDWPGGTYLEQSDRTGILGANPWNLGPPNGQQRVDDILASVKQYFHDCP